jgi:hypothetical protein
MRNHVLRTVVAALVALVSARASGHEFECEKKVGVLKNADGIVLGEDGLPVFLAAPAPVATISRYPATVGFEITIRNLASAPSVVTGASDPLLAALGGSVQWFGTAIAPGLSVPVGGSATAIAAVTVADQAACLRLFGSGRFDAPVCENIVENRFVVEHDVGSAECRARITCAPQGPPCATAWGGPKALGLAAPTDDVAVDAACNVDVTGMATLLPLPPLGGPPTETAFLSRLGPAGHLDQYVEFAGSTYMWNEGRILAVDGAGNRFVSWITSWKPPFAVLSRFRPDGTEAWRTSFNAAFGWVGGLALDLAGNPHIVGSDFGEDTFEAKLDAATGALLWTRPLPLSGRLFGAAFDAAGNLAVAGSDVLKVAPGGNVLWQVPLGAGTAETGAGVGVDPAGNVYVAGTAEIVPAPAEAFLVKLDSATGAVLWARELGGEGSVRAADVAVAADGSAWVVGSVTGGALPGQTWGGATDGLIARYGASGDLLWVKEFGAAENEYAEAVAVDPLGNGYVTYDSGERVPLADDGRFITRRYIEKLDPNGNVQ